MTRIARHAQLAVLYDQAIDYVAEFFAERPQLKVRGVASSTANVQVRYELLADWTRLVRRHDALAFEWQPPWRGFPSFGGLLTVQPASAGSELVLEGSYDPPGGRLGRLFDRMIGEKLAGRTMDALLRDITRYVEQRHSSALEDALGQRK